MIFQNREQLLLNLFYKFRVDSQLLLLLLQFHIRDKQMVSLFLYPCLVTLGMGHLCLVREEYI